MAIKDRRVMAVSFSANIATMKLSLILLLLGFVDWSVQTIDLLRVSTISGPVVGYRKSGYNAYEGIPYARPPVKKLRFRPPKPAKRWRLELNATQKAADCVQNRWTENGYQVVGKEDCLYLNVYVRPQLITKPILPVMVWFQGGVYSSGNEVDESLLMKANIALVVVNYRVGPLGFLSTGDYVVPGNMGLKDQSMALLWVSDNIAFFGGNPKSVTIFGLNSGAASVHYHYMSPLSAGLFHRGISISGVALDSWSQTEHAREKALRLGALLNCSTESSHCLVKCLRKRSVELILKTVAEIWLWLHNPFVPFGPVVEKQKCQHPFINATPIEIMTRGDLLDVPWIASITSGEGLYPAAEFVANDVLLKQLNDNWQDIAPYLLDYNDTLPPSQQKEVALKIRQHYLGSKQISSQTVEPLIQLIGDRLSAVNFEKAARLQAKVNKSPVWTYYYSYRATHSGSELISHSNKNFGVTPGDDIGLILDPVLSDIKLLQLKDKTMQAKIFELYTSFAILGVPKIGLSKWKQVDPRDVSFNYLNIKNPLLVSGMEASFDFAEKSFWETIDFDENKL
nr:venom carboxylesterase-6-like [Megalopta genalis]